MSPAAAGRLSAKKERLRRRLRSHGRILVAFSGGKDSFFLLREAVLALGKANVLACHVATPFTSGAVRERVAYFRQRLPFRLRRLRLDLLADPRLRRNPPQRCYLCKKRMFAALVREARRLGIATVADGSTRSDLAEHRPGRKALRELAIASPLRDAGFSGNEIAADLRKSGIAARFLASSTCLATRFPYDFSLDRRQIAVIGQVEGYLAGRGISPLRVRHIPDGVRVETRAADFAKVLSLKRGLLDFCRDRGLAFVTLDLGGIRSGPWDRTKPKAKMKRAKGKRQKAKVEPG